MLTQLFHVTNPLALSVRTLYRQLSECLPHKAVRKILPEKIRVIEINLEQEYCGANKIKNRHKRRFQVRETANGQWHLEQTAKQKYIVTYSWFFFHIPQLQAVLERALRAL